MSQGSRPDRVAEQLRQVLGELLTYGVKDPGIGFVTVTRIKVSPDLQLARVYYTTLGDKKQREDTARALERVKPFLRRQIGSEMRLRRVPELMFHFDEGIAHQARVEELLLEIQKERDAHPYVEDAPHESTPGNEDAPERSPNEKKDTE